MGNVLYLLIPQHLLFEKPTSCIYLKGGPPICNLASGAKTTKANPGAHIVIFDLSLKFKAVKHSWSNFAVNNNKRSISIEPIGSKITSV